MPLVRARLVNEAVKAIHGQIVFVIGTNPQKGAHFRRGPLKLWRNFAHFLQPAHSR